MRGQSQSGRVTIKAFSSRFIFRFSNQFGSSLSKNDNNSIFDSILHITARCIFSLSLSLYIYIYFSLSPFYVAGAIENDHIRLMHCLLNPPRIVIWFYISNAVRLLSCFTLQHTTFTSSIIPGLGSRQTVMANRIQST